MVTTLSKKRKRVGPARLALLFALLGGLTVVGIAAAPSAFASEWVATTPKAVIYPGQTATLFIASGGSPGQTVALHQKRADNTWAFYGTARLDSYRRAKFTVRPNSTTTYRSALVGSNGAAVSYSAWSRVEVLPKLNSWVALGSSRTIFQGQTAGLYVNSNARPGTQVVLQEARSGGTWATVAGVRLDSSSRGAFYPRPSKSTYYRAAVVSDYRTGTSISAQKVLVTVKADRGQAVVAAASREQGDPYVWGAAGPNSFDCSGLTLYVYRQFGISLPHGATDQARYGSAVSKSAMKAGDLMLFGSPGNYYHAAIYAGNGKMWEAATYGKPVGLHGIWSQNYIVRRLV